MLCSERDDIVKNWNLKILKVDNSDHQEQEPERTESEEDEPKHNDSNDLLDDTGRES